MNLLSKNAPLEASISKMSAVLSDVGCEATFSQEKHPLTHCYSVNLASIEAPRHMYSNGKGTLSEASMASALGEYIERLQTNNFFIDFHLPNRKYYPDEVAFEFNGSYLNPELLAIYNPNEELSGEDLVDYNSDYDDKIVALPFQRYESGETTFIPINILSNLYVSNGLATGNTPKEAQVQALSEIFERYVKIEIIKKAYALPSFPDHLLQGFQKVYDDLLRLRALGYIVEVLDASLGGKYPVTAISLINPKNSTLFVSFGAHPLLEVSLERTMTELMQGRDLEELDAFEVPTFDMSLVADSFNLESHFIDSNGKLGFNFLNRHKNFTYTPWNYNGKSSEEEFEFLHTLLQSLDKELYLREYNYLDFYSCQMIVPGLSEVYPIEDMIYNNKNSGKFIRDMILNFQDYDPQEILDNVDALEDNLNVEKYIGVIFKESFTMLEFKIQLHLLMDDTAMALELLSYSSHPLASLLSELIRMDDLSYDFEDFKEALENIFSKESLEKARKILNLEESFIDITLHQDYHNMLSLYDKLEKKKISKSLYTIS